MSSSKTILFFPLNSPGHINPLIGVADRLRDDHGFRAIFLVLGPMIGNGIVDHKHELIQIEEVSSYEDYPIVEGEDLMKPVDEEAKKKQGITKQKYPGAFKWPQVLMRFRRVFRMDPLDAFLESFEVFDKLMAQSVIENNDRVDQAIKSVNPDLVVVDAYIIPPCIVKLTHIPWIRLHSANPFMVIESKLANGLRPPPMSGYELKTKAARDLMRKENPAEWDKMIGEWRIATTKMFEVLAKSGETAIQKFMKEQDCPPLPMGKQAHDSPHLNLYLYPKEFDYAQDDDIFYYTPRWFGCDSLIRNTLGRTNTKEATFWEEKLAESMKGKKDLVFFSLGSIGSGDVELMKHYVNIFREDKERLYVFSKGVNGDKYELDPDNMIGGNYIPQTFFLDRASLAIIHGGNNSITECAYYGLPLIVLPLFGDQLDNAQRIQDLGFGKRLSAYDCSAEELRQAIDDILSNKTMAAKCRELGKSMRSRDEVRKISLMLKKLVEEGHLEQEFIEECRNNDVESIKF